MYLHSPHMLFNGWRSTIQSARWWTQTREGRRGQKSSPTTSGSGVLLLRTMENGGGLQCRREREGARPGVANYWIRPRVVLVLQTANSCGFNKNVCKKKVQQTFLKRGKKVSIEKFRCQVIGVLATCCKLRFPKNI